MTSQSRFNDRELWFQPKQLISSLLIALNRNPGQDVTAEKLKEIRRTTLQAARPLHKTTCICSMPDSVHGTRTGSPRPEVADSMFPRRRLAPPSKLSSWTRLHGWTPGKRKNFCPKIQLHIWASDLCAGSFKKCATYVQKVCNVR